MHREAEILFFLFFWRFGVAKPATYYLCLGYSWLCLGDAREYIAKRNELAISFLLYFANVFNVDFG